MDGQPQLTWANVIGTLMFAAVIAGGATAYVRERIGVIDMAILRIDTDARARAHELLQVDHRASEVVSRRLESVGRRIDRIEEELRQRNQIFVQQNEFKAVLSNFESRWITQADINSKAVDAFLSIKAWDAWRTERDARLNKLEAQVQQPKP